METWIYLKLKLIIRYNADNCLLSSFLPSVLKKVVQRWTFICLCVMSLWLRRIGCWIWPQYKRCVYLRREGRYNWCIMRSWCVWTRLTECGSLRYCRSK